MTAQGQRLPLYARAVLNTIEAADQNISTPAFSEIDASWIGIRNLADPRQIEVEKNGRKAATQDRILKASMELFTARGFEQTSISKIAAKSGVSRATIFWHFGNKATLFQETCRHFLVPFRLSLERSLIHLEPRTRIVDQLAAYEQFVSANSKTIHAFVTWVFTSPETADSLRRELLALHSAFVSSIERALGELLADPGEATELAITLVSMLHGNTLLALGAEPGAAARSKVLHNLLDRALSKTSGRRTV